MQSFHRMSARITQGTPAPKAESDSGEALSMGRPILDNRVGRAGCVYDADLRFIVEFGLKVMPGSARFKWQRLVLRMSRPRLGCNNFGLRLWNLARGNGYSPSG
jgi:hypothetical protein